MTLNEYTAKLDAKLAEIEKMDWLREPVQDSRREHGKQIFEDGEDSKGNREHYKDGSYKRYRQKNDRQTAYVDLRFTSDLQKDFLSTVVKIGGSWFTGVKRVLNGQKIDGMIKLYGEDKFKLKEENKKQFFSDISKRLQKILNG